MKTLILNFDTFKVEIENIATYTIGSVDNSFIYNFTYYDEEALTYLASNHGIKIYSQNKLYSSAIICAVGGSTVIHNHSAVIYNESLYVCCANKIFSLKLPTLELNWMTQADQATCFAIYKADNGLFVHGELEVSRLNEDGTIIWETGLRDIIVTIDSQEDPFRLQADHIELIDFSNNKYKLGFDGKFISTTLSENQNILGKNINKKPWWKIW